MSHINKPRYIEGVGFRCETEHTMKRWARWKDARKPGTYFITLSVAAHQNILGAVNGSPIVSWQWLKDHPEVKESCSADALYMKHAVVGERRLPFCKPSPLPYLAENNPDLSIIAAKSRLKVVLPLEALRQPGAPTVEMTPLGKEVERCWHEISVRHPAIETLMLCVMPNHLHAVVCVNHDMEKTLGDAIAGFMRGTTMVLRRMLATGEATWSHEAVVSELRRDEEERERVLALRQEALNKMLEIEAERAFLSLPNMAESSPGIPQQLWQRFLDDRSLPQLQRAGSKRRRGREQTADNPSLWEELFTATVCTDEQILNTRLAYTAENPFFKALENMDSSLFERRLHLCIAGKDYAAYGNLFLLKEAERLQVFCHRKARMGMLTGSEVAQWATLFSLPYLAKDDGWRSEHETSLTQVPYIYTEAYREQKASLLNAGADEDAVLVTPGISPGEKDIMYSALADGIRVIMIQADTIPSDKWHPGKTFRSCCGRGQLLILAPWQPEHRDYRDKYGNVIPSSTDYARFHDLNSVAAEICHRGNECSIAPRP